MCIFATSLCCDVITTIIGIDCYSNNCHYSILIYYFIGISFHKTKPAYGQDQNIKR